MIGEVESILDHLDAIFQEQEQHLNGKAGTRLHVFQRQSFEALKQVQFPDRKNEDWKYTSVQRLISPKYRLATNRGSSPLPSIPDLDSYVIPIVHGQVNWDEVSTALLETGTTLTRLQDAMESPNWNDHFGAMTTGLDPNQSRAFDLLNFAFTTHGFLLTLPKGKVLDKPIEIRISHDDPELTFSHPLFFIHAGAGSQCIVIERYESPATTISTSHPSWINALGFIRLERNASLQHFKWQDLPLHQNLVYKLLVSQHRDSQFTTVAFDRGGNVVRNNVEVELNESNTFTSLQAGFTATGVQSLDHQTRINHKVPHCESHELYKGIIDDQASGAFNGKVLVHPDAQKTNAYQQNDALVLSPNAVMNSKPQLEIFADDVKCSHGATIGQMDEKAMFYLRSRGIAPEQARHMLKSAFLAAVLESIPLDSLRDYITAKMVSRI